MFKKFSHIIFSLLLLVSTMGLVISKHYCGGSFVSISLFTEAESCCEMDGCCRNETDFYQVAEDFSITTLSEIPDVSEFNLFGFTFLLDQINEEFIDIAKNFIISESPPIVPNQIALSKRQVYLL